MADGLSERLLKLNLDGRKLIDDSKGSEYTLSLAMKEIIEYSKKRVSEIGGTIVYKKNISLYDCQMYFHKVGGPVPDESNKKVSMRPDGGIIFAIIKDKEYPILIVEDKVQGTNDNLFKMEKDRQASGNAIERGAKNIRGAEMIFSDMDIFPYVLFASGCDFHSSETISKRIEMMNMGIPNHYLDIVPNITQESILETINSFDINIKKFKGRSIASIFVKAHKWDVLPHGSSLWKCSEITNICFQVIDQVIVELKKL
jgi:hypothetical protein